MLDCFIGVRLDRWRGCQENFYSKLKEDWLDKEGSLVRQMLSVRQVQKQIIGGQFCR